LGHFPFINKEYPQCFDSENVGKCGTLESPFFSIWGVFTLFFQDIVNTIFSSIKYERKYVKKQLFLGLYRFADTELFTTVMSINSLKYSAKLPWLHSSSVVLIRGF